MRNGLFYLNNSGSRWVVLVDGKRDQQKWLTKSGKEIIRRVIYYESFGNSGSAVISYKGKKIAVLMDTILPD